MKIIGVDNFGRDLVSDTLVAENVTEYYAKHIVEFLNEKFCAGDYAPTFYKAVPDDHELHEFEP